MSAEARDSIAWAADIPLGEARALYASLRPYVGVVKVGLSLFVEHGPKALEAFRGQGVRLFLDLKLHDIPNTVELAAARAAALGVSYLTVHASGGEEGGADVPGTRLVGPIKAALPIGVDFVGRPFSEPMLLRIASAFQTATHHRIPPADFGPVPGEP